MLAKVKSCVLLGLEGQLVDVEVDVCNGLPAFDVVGLPDTAVKESRERVRAALKNSGFSFPLQRITVNLAPADLKKEGSLYDLPIALGILAATEQLNSKQTENWVIVGELSLDGTVRPIPGSLPMAESVAHLASKHDLMVSSGNAQEAALVERVNVCGVNNVLEAVAILEGTSPWEPERVNVDELLKTQTDNSRYLGDLSEIKGQQGAKRALEIAAAGGHNILLMGTPGSGKSMLARRLPTILPEMTLEECLEVTRIFSVAGSLPQGQPLVVNRPFRDPHHTASSASIIGGGRLPKPGEVSLATNGILFLDELPEYRRDVLETLRQPLEDKKVTVSRIAAALTYPASFMLVCAMNPCPCGYLGDTHKECTCTARQVNRYRSRISGPLLDRIDLHVDVPRLKYEEIEGTIAEDTSAAVRNRVTSARNLQKERYHYLNISCNAHLDGKQIRDHCKLTKDAKLLLRQAFASMGLSMRAHDRLLKVARTIADLDASGIVNEIHLAEAIQYRSLDRHQSGDIL